MLPRIASSMAPYLMLQKILGFDHHKLEEKKKMVISILLLAILFIAGFINIFFHLFPTKKFYAWIQSFFTKIPADEPQVSSSSNKEMSARKKAELKRVFATFDKDGDGFITKEELRESLRNLMLPVTDSEVEEMVAKVDANGDELIDFDEFCLLYEDMEGGGGGGDEDGGVTGGDEGDDLKEAFDVFDKDKDGLISVEELGLVLSSLGLKEGNKIESCKEMIKKVDVDGDGKVNFDEFRRMMKAGGGGGLVVTAF